MTREITTHRSSDDYVNDQITVHATGEPEPGGAHTQYVLKVTAGESLWSGSQILWLSFAPEPAGLTNEALLAVLIDRVRGFQKGPFACDENDEAVHHLHEALRVFQERTRSRQDRGVLGKQEP